MKEAANRYNYDLYEVLNSFDSIDSSLVNDQFDIEFLVCKGIDFSMRVLTGRIDESPEWIVPSIFSLGTRLLEVSVNLDEGFEAACYIEGKKVSNRSFKSARKALVETIVSNIKPQDLFLPKGKVRVTAKVEEIQTRKGSWDNYRLLRMSTDAGHEIYYRGNSSKMVTFAKQKRIKRISFLAEFEQGDLDGRYVSFAKRPSKIEALFSWRVN